MSCWRFDLKGKLLPYIDGRLEARRVSRLERHLLDCKECREFLLRLRAGQRLAQQLARVPLIEGSVAGFSNLMRQGEVTSKTQQRFRTGWGWSERLATPGVVAGLVALVVLQTAVLVVSNRKVLFGERGSVFPRPVALDLKQFHKLTISELRFNSQPHVATEGYVEDVHTDEEEGTVAFKLVESRGASEPFVVCEIESPIQMAAPRQGSHVRVYGVARYDAQADRNWYEVNPVFDIATLSQ